MDAKEEVEEERDVASTNVVKPKDNRQSKKISKINKVISRVVHKNQRSQLNITITQLNNQVQNLLESKIQNLNVVTGMTCFMLYQG